MRICTFFTIFSWPEQVCPQSTLDSCSLTKNALKIHFSITIHAFLTGFRLRSIKKLFMSFDNAAQQIRNMCWKMEIFFRMFPLFDFFLYKSNLQNDSNSSNSTKMLKFIFWINSATQHASNRLQNWKIKLVGSWPLKLFLKALICFNIDDLFSSNYFS